MKLRVFMPRAQQIHTCGRYGRIISELTADTKSINNTNRDDWIGQIDIPFADPAATATTLKSLNEASTIISSSSTLENPPAPKLILIQPPPSVAHSKDESLAYLRQVLPASAKWLERHPVIGGGGDGGTGSYGRTNAHGTPLDAHVAGICHHFPNQSISHLAALLDVYLPLRLALSPSNFIMGGDHHDSDSDSDSDWEAVMENTDLILHHDHHEDGDDNSSNIACGSVVIRRWNQIWDLQRLDSCNETYAVCSSEHSAIALQKHYGNYIKELG